MGKLQTKVAECKYRDPDRLLTEQFIGGLNNEDMTNEILRQVTALENTEEVTSECSLGCMHRLGAHRAQRSMLDIEKAKHFDAIWQNSQKLVHWVHPMTNVSIVAKNMQPSSGLTMERSVDNVARTSTSSICRSL